MWFIIKHYFTTKYLWASSLFGKGCAFKVFLSKKTVYVLSALVLANVRTILALSSLSSFDAFADRIEKGPGILSAFILMYLSFKDFSNKIFDIFNDDQYYNKVKNGAFSDLYVTWDKSVKITEDNYFRILGDAA